MMPVTGGREGPWPPRGLRLDVDFVPPTNATMLRGVVVTLHYEMYDGLPALRKWLTVRVGPSGPESVTVDTATMELLRSPNWGPELMTVVTQGADNPVPWDQQVVP